MNPGQGEIFIDNELLGNRHHGKDSTKTTSSSTTTTTNSGKESSYHSHGKDGKKNSKRKRENEKKSIGKKKKKAKLTKIESKCHGSDDVSKGREPFLAPDEPRFVSCEVDLSPMESLTEACLKYELLRENYQNLRHSYLHLKRRYDLRDLERQTSSFNRRISPGKAPVKEIQELEGVVDPLTSPPVIREVEVDDDGAKWRVNFLETDGSCWKVRWERVV